jgi:hypothetical protein
MDVTFIKEVLYRENLLSFQKLVFNLTLNRSFFLCYQVKIHMTI